MSSSLVVTGDGWCELEDHCVLSFRGSAVRSFLGRQLTCDIAELAPGKPQFGAWLTPKGRVLALLRLFERAPNQVDAVVPAALSEELIRRLRLFVMRDDVTIEADAKQCVFGLWGKCLALLGVSAAQASQSTTIRISAQPALAMLIGSPSGLESALDEHASLRGSVAHWQLLCIEAGVPQIELATREAFIPQMINLDRLGGVSFSKGCYPGQEIVARTQHLGRIKRRMFIARARRGGSDKVIRPGDVIVGVHGEDIGGRVVGVQCGSHEVVLLAVLPLDSDSSDAVVRIHDASGPSFHVFAPPYSLIDSPR